MLTRLTTTMPRLAGRRAVATTGRRLADEMPEQYRQKVQPPAGVVPGTRETAVPENVEPSTKSLWERAWEVDTPYKGFTLTQHVMDIKTDMLAEKMGWSEAELARIQKTVDISSGEATLEWTQTSPPAWHTFEELPLMKEIHD